eukprot:TRINITY_DN1874_c0_g1_i1.p1 TRINITY_DN1874_c0_g1~~TRINITY_DN1874_c0_g1_i1.p1  ORF type:complete len:481 (-),score=99.04 TRINITY_DN1874_c0_g1_i1:43-1446(-)
MSKRALVTGSNGFVASRLTDMLLEKGWQVTGIDVVEGNRKQDGFTFKKADLTKIGDLLETFKDVDTVFHVAALWKGSQVYNVNVKGTENVINACLQQGVKRLVYTSSGSVVYEGKDIVDGTEDIAYAKNCLDPYSATKIEAEKLVLAANGKPNGTKDGLMTVALRPHTIYGPGDKLYWPTVISKAREGKFKFCLGSGNNLTSTTYVDNCCHGHILAAEKLVSKESKPCGKAYNINDGESSKFWELLYEIGEVGGVSRKQMGRIHIPARIILYLAMLIQYLGITSDFTKESVSLATTHHTFSIERAKKDFGYQPIYTPKQGFDLTASYIKNSPDLIVHKKKRFQPLSIWLFFVTLASTFGTLQSFVGPHLLKIFHSLAPEEVTPLAARFFGCWTILASIIRFNCALDLHNKTVYRITLFTFIVALGVYATETLVFRTLQFFPSAVFPTIISVTSILWMTLFPPKQKDA